MKFYIFTITACILSSMSAAQANLMFECSSINKSSVGQSLPLPINRMVKLIFTPVAGEDQSYQMTFKWVNLRSNEIIGKPITRNAQVKITKGRANLSVIRATLGTNGDEGIFTSMSVPNLDGSAEPFIMYGWSKNPLTVTSSMEYRCEVTGDL